MGFLPTVSEPNCYCKQKDDWVRSVIFLIPDEGCYPHLRGRQYPTYLALFGNLVVGQFEISPLDFCSSLASAVLMDHDGNNVKNGRNDR